MMKKMGYNLKHGKGLNFGKGRRSLLHNFVPRGKPFLLYVKAMGHSLGALFVQKDDNDHK